MSYRSVFYPRCRIMLEAMFDGRGAKDQGFCLEIDPRNASIGLNGHYEADTWNLEFNAKLLPFDPDQLASSAVRIYMWDQARSVETGGEWATLSNEMLRGITDDVDSTMVGDDHVVKITGRDYTSLLADAHWNPKNNIKAGGPLDEVVQSIADDAAPILTTARFHVVWQGTDPPPSVGGLHRSNKKKGMWVKDGKSYWDVIWDLCIQHAYVPRVVGSTIYIGEPITQTRKTLAGAPKLVYGKTLTSLMIKRKFAHEVVPQVVVVAWDPKTQKQIEVAYPAERNIIVGRKDALGIELAVKKDDQIFFPAPRGITDKEALLRLAKMRFYHLGRGETTYEFKTPCLSIPAVSPGSSDVNVLQLRPGDAIGVEFDAFNREHLRTMEIGQRVEAIVAMGYRPVIASFIANNIERMELFKQDYYYNRGSVEFDVDEGCELTIEAVNFASEVREVRLASASEVLP